MGLFDGIFGKEENNQLKKQLIENSREITRLESEVSALSTKRAAIESELDRLRRSTQGKSDEINSLTDNLNAKKLEYARLTKALKELERSSAEQIVQANATIKELQTTAKKFKPEILAISADRDAKAAELYELQTLHEEKEKQFQERETRLSEKSNKLLQERQKFQQQASSLHIKEQHWISHIEPKLSKYEMHLSLDLRQKQVEDLREQLDIQQSIINAREADMVRRECDDHSLKTRESEVIEWERMLTDRGTELEAKASELAGKILENDDRARKLEEWAHELFEFRNRVAKLDDELEALKDRTDQIDLNEKESKHRHSLRLDEIRKKSAAIARSVKVMDERDDALKIREKTAQSEEAKISNSQKKILGLENQAIRLNEVIKSLEQAQLSVASYRSKFQELDDKYKALQVNHESALEKAELATELKNESDRLKAQVQQILRSALALKKFDSSIANPVVMAWMLETGEPENFDIEQGWVGTTGDGPWDADLLDSSLVEVGYQPSVLPHHDIEYIVVGRKGWSKNELRGQIDAREGRTLWIYSQEMFFAKLVTGRDPLESENTDLLDAFAKDHPALQWLMTLPEPWPNVTSEDSDEVHEVGEYDTSVSESPLRILGYKVGKTSDLSLAERRKILIECFESNSLVFSEDSNDDYIAKWGTGGRAQRLYRMAKHIKSQAEGWTGKRSEQARMDWVNDLKWLKEKFFTTFKGRFTWP